MLKIGDFSKLTSISIHMLRNYDKTGLLKPEQVDRFTGYRYYSEKQIIRANRIQVLKGLGFGLKEISAMLEGDLLGENSQLFLNRKIKEKEIELMKTQHQMKRMQQALQELQFHNDCTLAVHIKRFPARKVASVRGIIREFSEEGSLWERLDAGCPALGVRRSDVPYRFAITHSFDLENKRIDTEVQTVVEELLPDELGLRFFELPETEVAAVAYQGIYSKIGGIISYISHWVKENHYQMNGKPFQAYYLSPENEADPENFITEICFPIKQ